MIAFDTWVLADRFRYYGICIYAWRMVAAFQDLAALRGDVIIHPFVATGNSNGVSKFQASSGFEPKRSSLLNHNRLWRCGGVTAAALRHKADVIFCPHSQIVPLGIVPVVTTVHDVTPITSPSQTNYMNSLLRSFLWISAKFSHNLLTNSECSKRDLVEIYKLPPEKVQVIYHAYSRDAFNPLPADPAEQKPLLERHGIRTPYILHHGAVQPRKNLERLIRAYRLLLERRRDLDLQLVLAGPLGWQYEPILRAAQESDHRGEVIFTGALPEPELAMLVKGAAISVMPSLYEGFCVPMVEAMACGVPTIASNSSCLPEVSGGLLRYFNPLSVEDMAGTMEQVVDDSALRDELIRNGLKRAAEFSWERCARETFDFLIRTHEERSS